MLRSLGRVVYRIRGILLGALEFGDHRALTATVIYEIPKDVIAQIMRERPAIAEELSRLG
ncbi:hypothetical protein AB1J06_23775 [Agrobacterium tumefaciens]|uniref:hypothetical protein n=1 Tax=Agrobacterium tumefaciens TaxID=358 RepID=UPI000DD37566